MEEEEDVRNMSCSSEISFAFQGLEWRRRKVFLNKLLFLQLISRGKGVEGVELWIRNYIITFGLGRAE